MLVAPPGAGGQNLMVFPKSPHLEVRPCTQRRAHPAVRPPYRVAGFTQGAVGLVNVFNEILSLTPGSQGQEGTLGDCLELPSHLWVEGVG